MNGVRADIAKAGHRAEAIEAILADLPRREDRPQQVLLARRRKAAELLGMLYERESDGSLARRTTPEGAANEIGKLVRLSEKLRDHIRRMHSVTWEALEAAPNSVSILALLQPLEWTIDNAPLADLHGLPASPGRPAKVKCRRVAEAVAWEYRALTGEDHPTRTSRKGLTHHPDGQKETGAYTAVLQAVFDRLGLNASAQTYAADAIRATSGDTPPDLWPLGTL